MKNVQQTSDYEQVYNNVATINYDSGFKTSFAIYCIESVAATVVGCIMRNHGVDITIIMGLYFAISAGAMVLLRDISNMSDIAVSRMWVNLYLIMSVVFAYVSNSASVIFFSIFLQSLVVLTYTNKALCQYFSIGFCGVLVFMGVTNFYGIDEKMSVSQYCLGFGALIISQWIIAKFVDSINIQRRRNYEQEQSLDDLLKVIELKCDDARRATKSKSEFLSNMSHEIRTPINAVLGMNEMILRESTDNNVIEYAANVESSGKMLLSLVNDILDFSKIESGKMQIVPVDYQISSMFNDLVNMIKPRAEEKGLELKLEINPKIPSILNGDEVRIRQIVTNLLTNAVKYTDSGCVTFIADYEKSRNDYCVIHLSVKDTGRGIKPEDKSKLFNSFQRVDEKNNRNIEGTGLGLSITKHFVTAMNGAINIESTYGEGSTFSVHIPQKVVSWEECGDFKEQFEKSLKSRHTYHQSFTAPDAKVLVVDDNAMNLAVVVGLLKSTKVQIDKASGGAECLEHLRKNKYDLLLLDHMMPVMDGVETLRHIKDEKLDMHMPVIALTANAVSGAREMYLRYGFRDYLTKPIVGTALEKMLYKWLPKELIREESEVTDGTTGSSGKPTWPDFMDVQAALQYSFDGEEGIKFNINLYIDNVSNVRPKLEEAYEACNCADYAVYAHGLKSTSATIGLNELSELAKSLELAAKNDDWTRIEENHNKLMDMYDGVVRELKAFRQQ